MQEMLLNTFRVVISDLEEPRFENKYMNTDHGNS